MRQTKKNLAAKAKWVAVALLVVTADALAQTRTARQVVVSILDRKLAVIEDGRVLKTFPVAVGAADSPSPEGEFKIVNRVSNPTYYRPGVVIPAGPANPLGTRWIGLSQKGFGIHGTNAPRSIGKAASHGCVRMATRDLEQVFEMVRVGDTVVIRGERDTQIAAVFGGNGTADTAAGQ
ncbi:MAG: L,D-transpeptidase [Terriglobales bacterium]